MTPSSVSSLAAILEPWDGHRPPRTPPIEPGTASGASRALDPHIFLARSLLPKTAARRQLPSRKRAPLRPSVGALKRGLALSLTVDRKGRGGGSKVWIAVYFGRRVAAGVWLSLHFGFSIWRKWWWKEAKFDTTLQRKLFPSGRSHFFSWDVAKRSSRCYPREVPILRFPLPPLCHPTELLWLH